MSKLNELPSSSPSSDWREGHRTYRLMADAGTRPAEWLDSLLVERFAYHEAISQGFVIEVHALCERALPILGLQGEPLQLCTELADRQQHLRSAMVSHVESLGGDGGFTRFRLTLEAWVCQLRQRRHSRVWQSKTVVQILDELLTAYQPLAAWRWSPEVTRHIAKGPHEGIHPYCVQYRETDLEFMQRLLAQEGLAWRVEPAPADSPVGGFGHHLVIFADSTSTPQDVTSASSAGGEGIRFHRAGPTETQDTLQALAPERQSTPVGTTLLAWGQHAQHAVAASATTRITGTDAQSDWLDSYLPTHASLDGTPWHSDSVAHLAAQRQQAFDARSKRWLAFGNVRSLRAGHWFAVTQFEQAGARPGDTQQAKDERRQFIAITVTGLGVNNLPKDPRLLARPFAHPLLAHLEQDTELNALALHGHACRIEAQRRAVPWRPLVPTRTVTAHGPQTAIIVGPTGNTTPVDGREIYTDALGRVRIRFHWQDGPLADPRPDNRLSCWVRVARTWAGSGIGLQRTPRIGDEVVVSFVAGQAQLPIVIGSVPNGQGEGGIPPTPAGALREADRGAFAHSTDLSASAQRNLVHNGRSPAWHGGAAGFASAGSPAQNNPAALSGFKSKEWGAQGFNQFVWDDTPQQPRSQLATTQHTTQLNLGHLLHQADNHRGSFRGLGLELRTDASGALRAKQGVLLSTYSVSFSQGTPCDPAFDNAPGMALAKQAMGLANTFHRAAKVHRTTSLASDSGSLKAGQCSLSETEPALKSLHTALAGMADARGFDAAQQDATHRLTATQDGKLPHLTDPVVTVAAKAGVALLSGQHLQWGSSDVLSLQAGQDLHCAIGGQMRWHSQQSIGLLAGAIRPGDTSAVGSGITFVNAKGPIDIQAQAGKATLAAKDQLALHSTTQHIDWAAAKSITLATTAGAKIIVDAAGVRSQCPGKLTVHALKRSLDRAEQTNYPFPSLPQSVMPDCMKRAAQMGSSVIERSP